MTANEDAATWPRSGPLRVAVNLGNPVLVRRTETGLAGIVVDIAGEIARQASLDVSLVEFDSAGAIAKSAGQDAWDIGFLAVDPDRARDVDFTQPYIAIEGTYMVRAGSPVRSAADADREENRIAAGIGSAYDLYLSRTLRSATVVRTQKAGTREMIDLFLRDGLEVCAGVRQVLEDYAGQHPGYRVLEDSFMAIRQAIGIPKGNRARVNAVDATLAAMKSSGFIGRSLAAHGHSPDLQAS